MQCLRKLRITS